MSQWLDLVGALLLLAGAFLCLTTAIALVRFPDILVKLHYITKPQVLGLLLVAAGATVTLRTWWAFAVCTVMVVVQMMTAPVAATMLSRSAYRSGLVNADLLVLDELSDDLARAGFKLTEREPPFSPSALLESDFTSADLVPGGEEIAAVDGDVEVGPVEPGHGDDADARTIGDEPAPIAHADDISAEPRPEEEE